MEDLPHKRTAPPALGPTLKEELAQAFNSTGVGPLSIEAHRLALLAKAHEEVAEIYIVKAREARRLAKLAQIAAAAEYNLLVNSSVKPRAKANRPIRPKPVTLNVPVFQFLED